MSVKFTYKGFDLFKEIRSTVFTYDPDEYLHEQIKRHIENDNFYIEEGVKEVEIINIAIRRINSMEEELEVTFGVIMEDENEIK